MTDRPRGIGTPVDEQELQERLEAARRHVAAQREALRASRLRLREQEAALSARSDRALARVLRARGQAGEPPVPTHPPDWLTEPTDPRDRGPGQDDHGPLG